jgi:hypothetical protein
VSGAAQQRADGSEIESIEAFERQIAEAQAEIANSIERAGLRRDVLRHPLEAVSTAIGIFPGFLRRIEAARAPAPHAAKIEPRTREEVEEMARMIGHRVEFTIERLAGERLQVQVRRMALTLVGFLLLGAIISAGLAFWGGSSWRGTRMMDDCRAHQSTDPSGRHGCVIWLEPQKS